MKGSLRRTFINGAGSTAIGFAALAVIAFAGAAITTEGITTFQASILSVKENGILISASPGDTMKVWGRPEIEVETGEHYPEGQVDFTVPGALPKLMPKLFCIITTSTDQNGNAVAPEDALQALALCCKKKTPVTAELRGFILRCRKKVTLTTTTDPGTVGKPVLRQSTSANEYLTFANGYRIRTRLIKDNDKEIVSYDANVKLYLKQSPFIIYADVKSVGADAERDAAGAGADVVPGQRKP